MYLKGFKQLTFLMLVSLLSSYAYGQKNNPIESEKLHELVTKKIAMDKDGDFKDRYTIQIFYGEIQGAKTTQSRYNALGLTWSASMEYEEPNHKIWIGNYRSRLEADRALIEIRKTFPNAFVLKP